jgi:hypothetical protein
VIDQYLELQEIRPRLQKLQELLHSSPLTQEAVRQAPETSHLFSKPILKISL